MHRSGGRAVADGSGGSDFKRGYVPLVVKRVRVTRVSRLQSFCVCMCVSPFLFLFFSLVRTRVRAIHLLDSVSLSEPFSLRRFLTCFRIHTRVRPHTSPTVVGAPAWQVGLLALLGQYKLLPVVITRNEACALYKAVTRGTPLHHPQGGPSIHTAIHPASEELKPCEAGPSVARVCAPLPTCTQDGAVPMLATRLPGLATSVHAARLALALARQSGVTPPVTETQRSVLLI